jgi:hypothetical protein
MELTYPIIEPAARGFRVRVSAGAYLPGIYLNHLVAQKALARHLGRQAEVSGKRKTKQGA